ncbi:MAG: hypothetical protein IKA79_03720 [Lentisphaeria bacterium]|nr:hypothetical protein [Lentisphaeria bacterium]
MYRKVTPGDPVTHSARRENAISDMLNAFQAITPKKGNIFPFSNVAITGISPEKEIPQYTAVRITDFLKDLVWKVSPDAEMTDLWGITGNLMTKGTGETVVLRGITPAFVNVLDISHSFATLEEGCLQSTEIPTICRLMVQPEKTGEQCLIVFLDGGGIQHEIETAFKVSFEEEGKLFVSGGQINRNGTIITAGTKGGIEPKAGTLCVQSKIESDPNGRNGESRWTDPDYIYTDPAPDSWPIADIEEVEDAEGKKSFVIHQRITNIAILLVSKQCPLTRKGSM